MAPATQTADKQTRDAASETVSQLLAKVLNQLSMSAWLPSAALVLIVAFILELGASHQPDTPAREVLGNAVASMGDTGFGGVVLLFLVVVVTTMITQAFSFEAIRTLEGYWGPNGRIDVLARKRSQRHAERCEVWRERSRVLREAAWEDILAALDHERPKFTIAMMNKLKERITGVPAARALTDEQRDRVRTFDWEAHVNATTLRQLRNVEMRLADYPQEASRVMPTTLGNVLRRFEVETDANDIETFVERSYPRLPFALQLSHDEQRGRLDLYCSMVFVLWLGALAGALTFGWWDWPYTLAIALTTMIGSYVAYRAAVASARYYGTLLVAIADWLRDADLGEAPTAL